MYCQYFNMTVFFPSTKAVQFTKMSGDSFNCDVMTLELLLKQAYCNLHSGGPESEALLPYVFNKPPQDDHHDSILPRGDLQSRRPTL